MGLSSSSPPPPGLRRFAPVDEDAPSSTTSVKVITYNVLAPAYATDRSFPPSSYSSEHLAWPGRQARLVEEIAGYSPDVICLQEIQEDAWAADSDAATTTAPGPALRAQGFEGAWFWSAPPPPGSTGRSVLKPRRKGEPRVGPALLVRSDRFRVVAWAAIAFRDAVGAAALSGGHAPTASLLAGSRDGAVAAVLEDSTAPGRPLLLAASVHINWDYRTPDLKVLQCAALMAELRRFWEGVVAGGGVSTAHFPPPLIIGGDFNSLPLERSSNAAPGAPSCAGLPSGAYALLTSGALPPGHPHHPARQRGGAGGVTYDTAGWGALASARAVVGSGGREPALTTRTPDFEGTLDYIFTSPAHWAVVAVLEDPWPEEEEGTATTPTTTAATTTPSLAAFPPTPNAVWPSDHLAVGAVLELRGASRK